MKSLKIAAIATIITILLIISCSYAMPAGAEEADNNEFYPKLAAVFEIETANSYNIIRCVDNSQNIWEFYDYECEWMIGDIVNLFMWNDEIIEVYWEGHTDNLEMFFSIMEWH